MLSKVASSIVTALGNESYILAPVEESFLHCDDEKALARKIGELALAEVNLFKTTYNTTMFNYIEKVKGYLESSKSLALNEKYNIIEQSKPDILNLLNEQGYFKEVSDLEDLGEVRVIVTAPVEDISKYLYSQDTLIINTLEVIKPKYDGEYIRTLWSEVLGVGVGNNNGRIDTLIYGSLDKLDDCILLISMLDYCIEHAEVEETRLSSGQINILRTLKNNLYVSLSRMNSRYDQNVALGLVISSVANLGNGVINLYVDTENYGKFLENGGSVEILLGYFLSKFTTTTNTSNTYMEILSNIDTLKFVYNDMVKTDNIKRAVETNNKLITYYSIALSELYREFSDEAGKLYVPDINTADLILDRILANKNSNEQHNIEQVGYELFKEISIMPNYKKFMDSMSEISLSNPGLDPKECASLAFVDLVLNFTLDQLEVKKYNKIQGTISTGRALEL